MADSDIGRKGVAVWPAIIGLVVLGVLASLLFGLFGDNSTIEPPMVDVVDPVPVAAVPSLAGRSSPEAPAAVQQYLTTCAPRDPSAMSADHRYTSSCIQSLLGSVDAILQRSDLAGVDVRAHLQAARERAQQLARSAPRSTDHAGMTRDAFQAITAVLNGIQDARYPDLDAQVSAIEETVRSIEAGTNLLDQREPVQRFFLQAGDLLTAIGGGAAGSA
ncbi:MAG: hypothetical protein KY464_02975 [Gemmatimonadetes bacterium]|nr:hypothetical protein [Gemmatimonadota bacterium]